MAPTILINFCVLIGTFEAQQYDTIVISRKNPTNRKIVFNFLFVAQRST